MSCPVDEWNFWHVYYGSFYGTVPVRFIIVSLTKQWKEAKEKKLLNGIVYRLRSFSNTKLPVRCSAPFSMELGTDISVYFVLKIMKFENVCISVFASFCRITFVICGFLPTWGATGTLFIALLYNLVCYIFRTHLYYRWAKTRKWILESNAQNRRKMRLLWVYRLREGSRHRYRSRDNVSIRRFQPEFLFVPFWASKSMLLNHWYYKNDQGHQ